MDSLLILLVELFRQRQILGFAVDDAEVPCHLVVDGGYVQYGAAGEIAAILSDHAFDWLDAPVKRLAAENVPIPMSRTLEPLVQPSEAAIADAVRTFVGHR